MVAMLAWRAMWREMIRQSVGHTALYLWIDSSPQLRGVELHAGTCDLFDGDFNRRWLLPVVALPEDSWDATGKTIALLWTVLLVVGPTLPALRSFLGRVRSITTDQGTERKVVAMPDVLPEFLLYAGFPGPPIVDGNNFLFPRAMHMPGWKHKWDLVIRRALSTQRWFPFWLDHLKATISWLRSSPNRRSLSADLKRRGFSGLSELVKNLSLPTFAQWRWNTLTGCCRSLGTVFWSLAERIDPLSIRRNGSDAVKFRKLCYTMVDETWQLQLKFVTWLTEIFGILLQLGRRVRLPPRTAPDGHRGGLCRKRPSFAHSIRAREVCD